MAQTMTFDTWKYGDASLASTLAQREIVGYDVEAIDGSIGKIDDATLETDSGHLVVDTGPWIFGKKVMLPVGVLKSVDHDDEKVFVNRTKDEIKNAPEFDDSMRNDEKYRTELGSYYGEGGRGYRDWNRARISQVTNSRHSDAGSGSRLRSLKLRDGAGVTS